MGIIAIDDSSCLLQRGQPPPQAQEPFVADAVRCMAGMGAGLLLRCPADE
jgi:hypothetical protein